MNDFLPVKFDSQIASQFYQDQIEHFRLIQFMDSYEFEILDGETKIEYLIKELELSFLSGSSSKVYGLDNEKAELLENVLLIESHAYCGTAQYVINNDLDIEKYHSDLRELRIFVLKYFLNNYSKLYRKELYTNLINQHLNKFFCEIPPHKEMGRVFVTDVFVHCLLAKAYLYVNDISNFLSSAMNASFLHGMAVEKGQSIHFVNLEQFLKQQTQNTMAQTARQRWGDKVEQQRQRYLQHYKEKGFTTYKACALWIWENDNPENLDFDTIKNHLSKADKEQAKQKQNKIEKK